MVETDDHTVLLLKNNPLIGSIFQNLSLQVQKISFFKLIFAEVFLF